MNPQAELPTAWQFTSEGTPPILLKEKIEFQEIHISQRSYKCRFPQRVASTGATRPWRSAAFENRFFGVLELLLRGPKRIAEQSRLVFMNRSARASVSRICKNEKR